MANEGFAELITTPFCLKFPDKIGEYGFKIVNEFKYLNNHLENLFNI